MKQFDVVLNKTDLQEDLIPFFVCIQSDFIEPTRSRVVIPLRRPETIGPQAARLNPLFTIKGTRVMLMTQEITHLPITLLGQPIDTLANQRDDIIAAVDMLISGF